MNKIPREINQRLESLDKWQPLGAYLSEIKDLISLAQAVAVQETLEIVLKGLKSEDDSPQLRAIIAEVQALVAVPRIPVGTAPSE